MMHRLYPVIIFWSDEDQAYIADTLDLEGCSASGETPEEAMREIELAQEGWLRVARKKGMTLPEPSRHAIPVSTVA